MFTVIDKKQQQNAFALAPKHADSMQSADRPLDSLYFLQRNLGNSYLGIAPLNIATSAEEYTQGRFVPGSLEGKRLVHELPHVTQQRRGGAQPTFDAGSNHEQTAGSAADSAITETGSVNVEGVSGIGITRDINLQRKIGYKYEQSAVPPIIQDVLRTPGQPLDPIPRTYMESRFGRDLSQVRVYTDAQAADSAARVDARAYTVGTDLVFAAGEYEPHTPGGRRLLAHELAHVVQQSSVMVPATITAFSLGATNSPAEAAAERAADAALQPVHGQSEHAGQLAMQAEVGRLQVQRQPASSFPSAELESDIERIKVELDSLFYTEDVEEKVIGILWRWAERGSLASGYLDWIFDGLQMPLSGVFGDTTYYDAMLDRFDRADEVRRLRDSTRRYRGRESAKETRRQAEEKAERSETDIAADVAGGWTENRAELYELPPTGENLAWANREFRRLSMIPSDRLLPIERAASELVSRQGPKALLRKVHFITESERIERRKAQMRAVAQPFLEILMWVTAERLAAFAVEAIAARLFAAEARAVTALAAGEGEAAVSVLARRGAAEGGIASTEGPLIIREGYAYRVEPINNPATGDVVAMGRDLTTGEEVKIWMNIDTRTGFATRASGEMLPIREGRIDLGRARLGVGEAAAKGGAKAGEAVSTTSLAPAGTPAPAPAPRGATPGQHPVPEGMGTEVSTAAKGGEEATKKMGTFVGGKTEQGLNEAAKVEKATGLQVTEGPTAVAPEKKPAILEREAAQEGLQQVEKETTARLGAEGQLPPEPRAGAPMRQLDEFQLGYIDDLTKELEDAGLTWKNLGFQNQEAVRRFVAASEDAEEAMVAIGNRVDKAVDIRGVYSEQTALPEVAGREEMGASRLRPDDPTWAARAEGIEGSGSYGKTAERLGDEFLGNNFDGVSRQVHIRPRLDNNKPADFYFIADNLGRSRVDGKIIAFDSKLTSRSPFTENQEAGYPLLARNGGIVESHGKPGFGYGMEIPKGTHTFKLQPRFNIRPRPGVSDINFSQITPTRDFFRLVQVF